MFLKREFEDLALRILNYFDMKEDDEYNLKLLNWPIKELNECEKINLLHLAYKGRCLKFVSSYTFRKTIQALWVSSDIEVNKMRNDHNRVRSESIWDYFKVCLINRYQFNFYFSTIR